MDIGGIFQKLGLSQNNGLFILKENKWKGLLSDRTEVVLEKKINPYAFFIFNNEPFILFFLSSQNTNEIFKNCWNFNKSPIIFIVSEIEIKIYNGLSYNKISKCSELIQSDNWENNFNYYNIISGRTWEEYSSVLNCKQRVDEKLLENIKNVRYLLINQQSLTSQITNSLIGRLIFIRYLIDRNVVIGFYDKNQGILSNDDLCEILKSPPETYRLFDYIQDKFNGNLFPVTENEKQHVNVNNLKLLIDLLQGSEISSGQMSLFDIYDFSIIPVELVSNVYEFFIGKQEQEKKGAYYTPLFLVNNILSETVHKYFNENPTLYNCKILDPACGSGVFLVESLRKIITQYQKNLSSSEINVNSYKDKLKQLLTDNIFGIDKDENAINVAIFSLYVTLLDYLQPPEIVDFKFPCLLNQNFFIEDFFSLNSDFNDMFHKQNIRFQFIIGNPPWGKIDESVILYEKYWKDREKKEKKTIKVSRKEIAQVFLIRVSDFDFKECAFIITSKVLYNIKAKKFRRYFLNNFKIRKVLELSSMRHEIFDKSSDPSTCPASIIYFSYSSGKEINEKNVITHISLKPNRFFELFKMFTIEKHDQKQILQKYFMDYDWLWKVLVYGNILDFQFIKRIKEDYPTVKSKVHGFTIGTGLKYKDGKKKVSTIELIGLPFIDTSEKDLDRYFFNSTKKWVDENAGFVPNKQLFKKNVLIVKKGCDNQFKLVAAISANDIVFTDSIFAIQSNQLNAILILQSIAAIFNSRFASSILVQTGSSLGIEREQIYMDEKLSLPYSSSPELVNLIPQIEKAANDNFLSKQNSLLANPFNDNEYNLLLEKIDNELLNIFDVNSQEISLIDYVHEISIPLIKRRDTQRIFGSLNFQNNSHKVYLSSYAKVFVNHFNNIYNTDNHYFEVEICLSSHVIGMLFKVISDPSTQSDQIYWNQNHETEEILRLFSGLSVSNLGQDLFVQKDIKGFESNFFYVIKPNEYKCWHRAIAYLDLGEFIEEFLSSEKKEGSE